MSVHPPVQPPEAPVQPAQPLSHKDAKAAAKAAKAYAKAQRPWFKKKRFVLPLGGIILIVGITILSSSSGSDPNRAVPDASSSAAPASSSESEQAENVAPAGGGPTATLPIQNGDWRLDSIRIKDDGLGDFGGTARVTYTGANSEGGTNIFTVTVFVGGEVVGVLLGSADAVQPGTAATVQFISQDKLVAGPYEFDFQNDL